MLTAFKNEEELTKSNVSASNNHLVLTDIFQEDINMVIWKRKLHDDLAFLSTTSINEPQNFSSVSIIVKPNDVNQLLLSKLPESPFTKSLVEDISILTDMFCCLFDLQQAGIRLAMLDQAMCPRFHVDRVPCRLITTYTGLGTQWLNNCDVDRNILGKVDYPLIDQNRQKIETLHAGEVALLKGESWIGNEKRGIVHRSPDIKKDDPRLLLTIDFA